jgi:hypothetical protein
MARTPAAAAKRPEAVKLAAPAWTGGGLVVQLAPVQPGRPPEGEGVGLTVGLVSTGGQGMETVS